MKPAPEGDGVFLGACWRLSVTSTGYNWPVGKGAGRNGRAEELWRVGKSEEVGFKARKQLITRKRECSARVGRSRADDCGRVVCVRSKGS